MQCGGGGGGRSTLGSISDPLIGSERKHIKVKKVSSQGLLILFDFLND